MFGVLQALMSPHDTQGPCPPAWQAGGEADLQEERFAPTENLELRCLATPPSCAGATRTGLKSGRHAHSSVEEPLGPQLRLRLGHSRFWVFSILVGGPEQAVSSKPKNCEQSRMPDTVAPAQVFPPGVDSQEHYKPFQHVLPAQARAMLPY